MAPNRAPPRPDARGPAHLTRLARLCVRDAFCWPRSPRAGPFPPPPPQPLARRCSAASQVLRACPTSRARSSRAYRLSVPLTSRHPPTYHPANPPGRGIIDRHGRPRDLPVLSMKRSHACTGSPTPRGPMTARENAATSVAFRRLKPRRHPKPRLSRLNSRPARTPIPTLRCALTETPTHGRGRRDSLDLRRRTLSFPSLMPVVRRFLQTPSKPSVIFARALSTLWRATRTGSVDRRLRAGDTEPLKGRRSDL
jgi:hypothetical protein